MNRTTLKGDAASEPSVQPPGYRRFLSRERPGIFVLVVVSIVAVTLVYELRANGIFACSAAGYSTGGYLAYCNSVGYGDYDHGAFWFDLEPAARDAAASADVLFLGTSRVQFAFSAPATKEWFAEHELGFYLLGFSHSENVTFAAPLLAAIAPRAEVYIVNVDRFFENRETEPASEIFHGDAAESRYKRKRLWQFLHRALCSRLPLICGRSLAFYRVRDTGFWAFQGNDSLVPSGVSDSEADDLEEWERHSSHASTFISSLPVRRDCVLLTVAPWAATPRAEAIAIADSLGVDLFAPELENLRTFDGSHLDASSAQRWSQRFFEAAGDRITACASASAENPRSAGSVEPLRIGALSEPAG